MHQKQPPANVAILNLDSGAVEGEMPLFFDDFIFTPEGTMYGIEYQKLRRIKSSGELETIVEDLPAEIANAVGTDVSALVGGQFALTYNSLDQTLFINKNGYLTEFNPSNLEFSPVSRQRLNLHSIGTYQRFLYGIVNQLPENVPQLTKNMMIKITKK